MLHRLSRRCGGVRRHALVKEPVQVGAIELVDRGRARVERILARWKDLALTARGKGAEVGRKLQHIVYIEFEVHEACGEPPRSGPLPRAEAVAERGPRGARGDLIRQRDLRRAVTVELKDLRPLGQCRDVGAREIAPVVGWLGGEARSETEQYQS